MPSLLGELYERLDIAKRTEAIASQGLSYLLESSDEVRIALADVAGLSDFWNVNNISAKHVEYHAESVNREEGKRDRVDIEGIYDDKPVVMIEAKFGAPLTSNQPCEYLNRLDENGVLLFVCLEGRCIALREELKGKLEKRSYQFDEIEHQGAPAFLCEGNKILFVISWEKLLKPIRLHLEEKLLELIRDHLKTKKEAEKGLEHLADVMQLIGYCEQVNGSQIQAFEADKFLSKNNLPMPDCAKLVEKMYAHLEGKYSDDFDSRFKRGSRSRDEYKSKVNPKGMHLYYRYFRWGSFACGLFARIDFLGKQPKKMKNTPFWFLVTKEDPQDKSQWLSNKKTADIADRIKDFSKKEFGEEPHADDNKHFFLPLEVKYDASEEEMVEHMAAQLEKIYERIMGS